MRFGLGVVIQFLLDNFLDRQLVTANFAHFFIMYVFVYGAQFSERCCIVLFSLHVSHTQRVPASREQFINVMSNDKYLNNFWTPKHFEHFWVTFLASIGLWIERDLRTILILHH